MTTLLIIGAILALKWADSEVRREETRGRKQEKENHRTGR